MKKVLLISIVITLIALTGCIYTPATHIPTVAETATLDIFANDTSATLDTVDCVILEAVNANWKESYVDTATGFIGGDSTFLALLGADGAALTPGSADKMRINVNGAFLSGYASITMAAAAEIDIYMDIHGAVTIWDANGDIVDYDVYGVSPACAMVFKGDDRSSVIREHYTYSLDAGDYYLRFKKAENATYKGKNYFFAVVN
ncbi:MAG: hypothetical protein K9N05_03420 [Candidatus Marinimicrobia bacterium]|nr:hypothetical protein [Candidatus Neomarinimicrobiota bacterium]